MSAFCIFSVNCVFCVFLQHFDTVGWVFWPVKTVTHITYVVLVETLNHAQSINQSINVCYVLLADELGIPMTVDEYSQQLSELKQVHFLDIELLPGTQCHWSIVGLASEYNIILGGLNILLKLWNITRNSVEYEHHVFSNAIAKQSSCSHGWLLFGICF